MVAITDFLDQAINDLETEFLDSGFHPLTFGTHTSVPFLSSVYTGVFAGCHLLCILLGVLDALLWGPGSFSVDEQG